MENEKGLQKVTSQKSERELTPYDFIICPNCGETEVGKFCPNCGQSNKDYNKPVKEIAGDLLDSINLDIRLLNTIIPFFTKPGFLTEEYFNGRRKRYVPPMRMYMFVSIIFFFLVQYTSSDDIKDNMIKVNNDEQTISRVKIANNENDNSTLSPFKVDTIENDSIQKNADIIAENLDKEDLEKIKEETLNDSTASDLEKQFIVGSLNAVNNKEMFFDKFLNNISIVLFLLMPFFALILALILWKSKMLYIKHLIFSINFHSFIFGLTSLIMVIGILIPDSISIYASYLWLGIPIYLMLGIKRFYKRKYVGAFFKMLGSTLLYSFVICIVLIVILAFTAKGFYNI